MSFTGCIYPTDKGWYDALHARGPLEEVNFWRPRANRRFRILQHGEPLLFKLKRKHADKIVGFGFFVGSHAMSVREAWLLFGTSNGVASLQELRDRVAKYAGYKDGLATPLTHPIGALLLSSPVLFPEHLWVDGPADWKAQTVSGMGYDLTRGEGLRIWRECYATALSLEVTQSAQVNMERGEDARRGEPVLVQPRLGQGTFRMAVRQAYAQCAVSREHALPALDAAHIKPFADAGPHAVSNGLLLRADIHRLFDGGYVSVSPDYRFEVSGALNEEFGNGKIYYALSGQRIALPRERELWPEPEYLEHHQSHIFLGT